MGDPDHGAREAREVEAARGGDLSAFNSLVLRYQTRVYNLCLRMLADPDAAADATQEAFISAYRAMPRFRGEAFKTWLFRIATNACLDMLRSRKRRPTVSIEAGGHSSPYGDSEEDEPLPIADTHPDSDPEARALRLETMQAIGEALDLLPDEQRAVLVLVDVQGFSYEEAALVTGANLGTVKSRINRARSRVRDHLKAQGILPSGELKDEA